MENKAIKITGIWPGGFGRFSLAGLLFLCSQPHHAIHISAGDTRSVLMLNKWQTRKISEYHSDFTA